MRKTGRVSCHRDCLPVLSHAGGVRGSGEKAQGGVQSEQNSTNCQSNGACC